MRIVPGYLPLKDLADYSGLSVRTLRDYLRDPVSPLPYYQPAGGKVLVKREDFDAWMERFRKHQTSTVDAAVESILAKVS